MYYVLLVFFNCYPNITIDVLKSLVKSHSFVRVEMIFYFYEVYLLEVARKGDDVIEYSNWWHNQHSFKITIISIIHKYFVELCTDGN